MWSQDVFHIHQFIFTQNEFHLFLLWYHNVFIAFLFDANVIQIGAAQIYFEAQFLGSKGGKYHHTIAYSLAILFLSALTTLGWRLSSPSFTTGTMFWDRSCDKFASHSLKKEEGKWKLFTCSSDVLMEIAVLARNSGRNKCSSSVMNTVIHSLSWLLAKSVSNCIPRAFSLNCFITFFSIPCKLLPFLSSAYLDFRMSHSRNLYHFNWSQLIFSQLKSWAGYGLRTGVYIYTIKNWGNQVAGGVG